MGFRSKARPHIGYKDPSGFTLIEVIIVLAIIGLLSVILAPTVAKYVQNSKLRRATLDVENIANAMGAFYNDLGDWPIWQSGTSRGANDPKVALLYGPGDLPQQGGAPSGDTADTLENQIILNTPVGTGNPYPTNIADPTLGYAWRGPYIEQIRSDPWGNAYLVNVKFLWPSAADQADTELGTTPVFVLSAGPNQVVDTDFEQTGPALVVGLDDVVFRVK